VDAGDENLKCTEFYYSETGKKKLQSVEKKGERETK